jgi:hypothetical protein
MMETFNKRRAETPYSRLPDRKPRQPRLGVLGKISPAGLASVAFTFALILGTILSVALLS